MASGLSVNIRMYKVGELGDCFLLRFKEGNTTSHVLIDCGSFRNGKESKARMAEIAADIKDQLEDGELDVVAGTHQHNDHLSGFKHASKTFEKMNIGEVWLSWLDDPDDLQAGKIGKEYNNFLSNLRNISANLASKQAFANVREASAVKERMDNILGFYGINTPGARSKSNEKSPPDIPAQATAILRKLGKKTKYLTPGQVLSLPGLPANSVKVYVLGPPKDEKLLKDPNPNSKETYDHELAINNAQAEKMLLALDKMTSTKSTDRDEQPYPFNEPDSESLEAFNDVWKSYYSKNQKWRQIDHDWLKQAERLALWLDSYTNNSSLVLAFELVKSNKVLLFVGDAQTGNWTSWKTIQWKKTPPGFSWRTLLQKTVLYKVGHHCSHNATLVEGLEAMTHEDLVAMIPVDKSDGNIKKKNGWRMPAKNLYQRLREKTRNRILRMDEGIVDINDKKVIRSWEKISAILPKDNPLYVEYEIKG